MCALLEIGFGIEIAKVRGHRELDIHEEHVTLGEQKREVGDALLGTSHCSAFEVLLVLNETSRTNDVFGHALAPLTAVVGAGQCFAKALRCAGEPSRDLDVIS